MANVVEILIKARDGASKPLGEAAAAVKFVGSEARAGVKPLREYREELKQHARQLEEVVRSSGKTTSEYKVAVEELANVKRELKGVNDELKNQTTGWDKFGGTLQSIGTGLTVGITAPLTILGTTGVRSAQQLEVFQGTLVTLIGDADRAHKVFEDLYEFDTSTTFSWPSLSKATTLLSAFNVEAEDLIPTLGRLGDISSAINMDIAELAEIYGKAKVQGRLFMEDINQLTGRGIPIIQELARQFGVTEDQVRGLVSEGKVGFANIEQAFVDMTSEGGRFFGMMAAQTETSAGGVMALRKEFEQVTDRIGQALLPMIDALVDRARQLIDWFVNLDDSTQNLIINIGLVAAALGPLLGLAGSLIIQIPKLVAGFKALRGVLTFFTGPVGILIGVATGIAAVVAALSGPKGSLEESVQKASDALASGDANSLASALDDVAAKLAPDDPLRTRLTELQAELRTTGETAEEAMKKANALLVAAQTNPLKLELQALQESVAKREQILAGVTSEGPARQARIAELETIGNRMLDAGEIVPQNLIDELFQLRAAADGLGMSSVEIARQTARVADDKRRIEELQARIAQLENPTPTTTTTNNGNKNTNGNGTPPPAKVSDVQQRVKALRAELEVLQREVELGLADTATLAERRFSAVDSAVRDLIRLGASGDLIDALLGERSEFEEQVRERAKRIAPIIRAELLDAQLHSEQETTEQLARDARVSATVAQQQLESEHLAAAARAPLIRAEAWDNAWFNERQELEDLAIRAHNEARVAQQEQESEALAAAARAPLIRAEDWDTAWFAEMEETERLQAELAAQRVVRENQRQAAIRAIMANYNGPLDGSVYSQNRNYLNAELDRELNRFRSADLTTTNEDRRVRDERRAAIQSELDEAARQAAATLATQLLLSFGQSERWSAPGALTAYTRQARLQSGLPIKADLGGDDKLSDPLRGYKTELRRRGAGTREDATGAKRVVDERTQEQILAAEISARQAVIDQLTTMASDKSPLANFGAQLLNAATQKVPAFGAALDGFVQAGPIGAIVGALSELLFTSKPMVEAFELINEALAPLGDLLGHIIAPAVKLFGFLIRAVVDALVGVYNMLLGWLFGYVIREDPDKDDEKPSPIHSNRPPSAASESFSGTGPGVQYAVATPLLEAAQINLTASTTSLTAAATFASASKAFGDWVTRLAEDGVRVVLEQRSSSPATTATTSAAYLR